DADLRAHAELTAVGKTGRGIPVNRRRIHFREKFSGTSLVPGDDAVRMSRTEPADMIDCLLDVVDNADVQDVVVIFGGPILLGGRLEPKSRLQGPGSRV